MLHHKIAVKSCSIGFVYKMTARVNHKVTNKAEEARCLKNMPQQLQVAGQVTHDVKAVLMCEYLRSHFVGNCMITTALNTVEKGIVFRSTLALIKLDACSFSLKGDFDGYHL